MNKLAVVLMTLTLSLYCCVTALAETVSSSYVLPSASYKYKAIALCIDDLTEHEDWSSSEAYLSLANCDYGFYEEYLDGTEPVWVITFAERWTSNKYQFVLGCEAEWIIRVDTKEGLPNKDDVLHVSKSEEAKELPGLQDYYNSEGQFFYNWTISEKAEFSNKWRQYIDDLVLSGKLEREWIVGEKYYQWTRRMYGVPSVSDVSEEEALANAFAALHKLEKNVVQKENYVAFFDVTDYDSPQWRFYIDYQYAVIVDAKTGEILFVRDGNVRDYDVDEFMMQE